MSNKPAGEDALNDLHTALAKVLTEAVKGDDCSAAVLSVARGFLKDNSITCAPDAGNATGALERALSEKRSASQRLMPDDLKDALDNLGGVRVN